MRETNPISMEKRINALEKNGASGDYEDLSNKPKIENVEIVGNMTFEELGIASAEDLSQTNEDLTELRESVSVIIEKFYENVGAGNPSNIDIAEALTKYDALEFVYGAPENTTFVQSMCMSVEALKELQTKNYALTLSGYASRYLNFNISGNRLNYNSSADYVILYIYGIKY